MHDHRQQPAGATGVLEISIVLVALLAIGLAVWFAFGHRSGVKVGPVKLGKNFNAQCDYHDANLCKFLNNYKNVKNFVVTSAVGNTVSTYKVEGDNKFQLVTTTNGKESYNTIIIDRTMYIKDYGDGKWWQQTEQQAKIDEIKKSINFLSGMNLDMPNRFQYKFIAKEPCSQSMCYKYQLLETSSNSALLPGQWSGDTVYIWFDDKDYNLRKTSIQLTGTPAITMTYSYDHVSIAAPSPTKTLAPGALPTESGLPSGGNSTITVQ